MHNDEEEQTLAISTGGFGIFCSLLFLFERLGAPALILFWILVGSIFAIAALFALSRATITARNFFVVSSNERAAWQGLASASDSLSGIVVLFLIALPTALSGEALGLVLSLVAGIGLGGLFFARPLRKSGAYSIPELLHLRYGSSLLRLLALIVVSFVCLILLYAQTRLAGLYFSQVTELPFASVTGSLLVLAAFVSLMGGLASTSRVQVALFLLLLIAVFAPAMWLAFQLKGIPLPQLLPGGLSQPPQIMVEQVSSEIAEFSSLMPVTGPWLSLPWLLLLASLVIGFASLPHQLGRHFTTTSPQTSKRSIMTAMILVFVVATALPALQFAASFAMPRSSLDSEVQMPGVLKSLIPLAVLIAGIMTSSVLVTTIANTIAHDGNYLLSFGRRPKSRQVFTARILVVIIGLGAWYGAGRLEFNAFSALLWALVLGAGCLLPALVAATRWAGSTKAGISCGMLLSALLTGAGFYVLETPQGMAWLADGTGISAAANEIAVPVIILPAILVNLITIALVSMFSRPPDNARQMVHQLNEAQGPVLIRTNL